MGPFILIVGNNPIQQFSEFMNILEVMFEQIPILDDLALGFNDRI